MSPTDRLCGCITTLQSARHARYFKLESKPLLTLRQLNILPQSYRRPQLKRRNIYIYIYIWRSRDELISDVFLWTPTYVRAKAGRPARTYIQQLCEDKGCSPEDLPETMNDREKWREKVRDIRASGTTWWYIYIYIYICLSATGVFISWKELCICALLASRNSPGAGGSIYVYFVIHRQTVSLYHDSSVWLDTISFKLESKPGRLYASRISYHTHTHTHIYIYMQRFFLFHSLYKCIFVVLVFVILWFVPKIFPVEAESS